MKTASDTANSPYAGQGINRRFYLPRLAREFYQADAVIHWTLSLAQRSTGWLTEPFHARFREIMLHAAARESLFCPTYCLMPDHIHLVWMGLKLTSNQRNAMKFLREYLGDALRPHQLQPQSYDHVLHESERKRRAFSKICFYIMDNARVAELVTQPQDWSFCGAIIPGYPSLHPLSGDFWPLFWKLYQAALAPDASQIKRPKL